MSDFEEEMKKKQYLATHSAINPVMVQLLLSKRGLKASRQATTQLLANSLHPFLPAGEKEQPNKVQLHWIASSETEQGKHWDEQNGMKSGTQNRIYTVQTYTKMFAIKVPVHISDLSWADV